MLQMNSTLASLHGKIEQQLGCNQKLVSISGFIAHLCCSPTTLLYTATHKLIQLASLNIQKITSLNYIIKYTELESEQPSLNG